MPLHSSNYLCVILCITFVQISCVCNKCHDRPNHDCFFELVIHFVCKQKVQPAGDENLVCVCVFWQSDQMCTQSVECTKCSTIFCNKNFKKLVLKNFQRNLTILALKIKPFLYTSRTNFTHFGMKDLVTQYFGERGGKHFLLPKALFLEGLSFSQLTIFWE